MTGIFSTPAPQARLLQIVRLLAIALLTLAIIVRFAHLDRKVYWHDEAYTSTVITARPGRYFHQDLFQNQVVKPADLLAYQQFVPGLTLNDMVVRKGTEDVQHPPIYYIMLRVWAQLWGTTPAVTRGFSSLLSLLLFPAVYWLCSELFESRLSGWVAIALFAVSPLHLVYAQEVREFEWWTVLILVSSTLLLRAIRTPSSPNWIWYGLSMLVTCYTALFSVFIAIGHFAYILLVDPDNHLRWPCRVGPRTISGFVTLLLVAVLFTPWLYFMVAARDTFGMTTSWTAMPIPWLDSVRATMFNFSYSFVDFNLNSRATIAYLLAIPVLVLQGYATSVLCRTAPRRVWWFILTFVGVTAVAFGLPDLVFGGQRFTVNRYLIPCFVGLQLAVVYLLTLYLTESRSWRSRFAQVVGSSLIVLGILSCAVYTQANTWWNKSLNSNYHQVAELINGSDRPLIIVDSFGYNPASMISLSYLLKPDTQFLLLPAVGNSFTVQRLPAGVQTVFLFNLPEGFRQQFESRFQQELVSVFYDPWNQVWKNNAPLEVDATYQSHEEICSVLPALGDS